MLSASLYDTANPNLITRLIPAHYLEEGEEFEGLPSSETGISSPYGGSSIPGSGKLTSAQIITMFLFTWSKFFDEMKIFIDHFSHMVYADYDREISVSDKFLYFAGKYFGLSLPRIFGDSSIAQYVDGENLKIDISRSASSLHAVQNEIWRRILSNMQLMIRTKGTRNSITSLIRSIGIHPENNFRIREFGGPVRRQLIGLRERRSEISTLLAMSGNLANISDRSTTSYQGFHARIPHMTSSFLSGARIEPGVPEIQGTFQKINNYVSGTSAPFTRLGSSYSGYLGPGVSIIQVTACIQARRGHMKRAIDFPFSNWDVQSYSEFSKTICHRYRRRRKKGWSYIQSCSNIRH